MDIDQTKVRHAIENGIPLVLKTHAVPREMEVVLGRLLDLYLETLDQREHAPLLAYCLQELVDNARKANLKRVHFRRLALGFDRAEDYSLGMESFVRDCETRSAEYRAMLIKSDLSVKVTFLIRNNVFYLSVRNSAKASPYELEPLRHGLAAAWASEQPVGRYFLAPAEPEGAGFGLSTVVLILKRLGLDERSFEIGCGEADTTVTIRIPMSRVRVESVFEVTREISAAVESIPPFPPNLQNLFRLLEDPDVDFRLLAQELGQDPAMTSELIKYINSASNRGYNRIDDLEQAIRIVGTRGLRDLMYPYGAHKILGKHLADQRQLWENAVRVSRYSMELAKEYRFDWNEKGETQIVGLLYNLGQIVLTFLYPELSLKILEFCRQKRLSIETFDSLTHSVNPSKLAALIVEKWNFPRDLVTILGHVNSPLESPPELQRVASAVYLASSLRSVELGLLQYSQISEVNLQPLGISGLGVAELHEKLQASAPAEVELFVNP